MNESKSSTTLTVRVRDLRGIHEIELPLKPGGNLILGRNGAGKTTTINAALAAAGNREALKSLAPRDGAARGSAEAFGVTLKIGARASYDGAPSIQLGDVGHFGDLIRPDHSTREARAKARIRALLHFRPLSVDEETLLRLAGGAANVAAVVQADAHWEDLSVLDLAEAVRRAANDLALYQEKLHAQKVGEVAALGEVDLDLATLPEQNLEELRDRVEQQRLSHARLVVEARGRATLLAQQAEIREALGDRPDLDDLQWQVDEVEEEVAEIQIQLAKAQARLVSRKQALADGRAAAERWDRDSEVLRRPIEGATAEEADGAAADLTALSRELEEAAAAAEARLLHERLRIARSERDVAEEAARMYREIAKGVPALSAALLGEQDLPGLILQDGELAVVLATGEVRAWDELSFGEQVRTAARIVLTAYREAELPVVVALAPEFWAALDFQHRAEVVSIASEEGIYLLLEEPTEGDLAVQHIGANNASEVLGVGVA